MKPTTPQTLVNPHKAPIRNSFSCPHATHEPLRLPPEHNTPVLMQKLSEANLKLEMSHRQNKLMAYQIKQLNKRNHFLHQVCVIVAVTAAACVLALLIYKLFLCDNQEITRFDLQDVQRGSKVAATDELVFVRFLSYHNSLY